MVTSGRMVYLAGPIDGIDRPLAENWRKLASLELAARGFSTFNPASAFGVPDPAWNHAGVITAVNRRALELCDAVLVGIDVGAGWGLGTWREVEYARHGIIPALPVVVWVHPEIDEPQSLELHDVDVVHDVLGFAVKRVHHRLLHGSQPNPSTS